MKLRTKKDYANTKWSIECLQETCKRLLHFTVPRVVAVSPQMRLVEDNASSVSLLDIYKQVGLLCVCTCQLSWLLVYPLNG